MTVNLEPIKGQLAKDIGGYICLHRDDMAGLVAEVEHLRGERAAVVAYLNVRAETLDYDGNACCGHVEDLATDIERGLHRREEGV